MPKSTKTPTFRVPAISDRRLQTLAEHIRPVVCLARGHWKSKKTHGKVVEKWFEPTPTGPLVRFPAGQAYFLEVADLRQSDLTTAQPTEKAGDLRPVEMVEVWYPTDATGPAPAHVLAQLPRHLVNEVVAYEIIEGDGDLKSDVSGDYKQAYAVLHATI